MPRVLQVFSWFLPLTLTCDVVKDVVVNQTINVNYVYLGFLVPMAYAVIFFGSTLLIIKKWGFKI